MTQQQLADRLGTGKASISKMERGASKYNQSNLEAWAAALTCDPADLISRPPPKDGEADPEHIRRMIERAPPDQRRRAFAVIEAMLKAS